MSFTELARQAGLSVSAVHQRVRRLETEGVITGYVALCDPQVIGLPLTAFVYGGANDTIADPSENLPFAAALRAAGASAQGTVYKGGHDMATVHAHLRHMLLFAAHSLSAG